MPKRNYPDFKPNVHQFGIIYFRDIYSKVAKKK